MSSNIIHGSNGSSTPIEPFEPRLTSLPPELASQLMAARYIAVASLSIFIWEILINIGHDYDLLFEHRLRLPTVIYFISRLCCLGFGIISVKMIRSIPTYSNSMCVLIERIVTVFYCSTVVFTSLLIFFRTRAVFNTYPRVVAFFALSWLTVLGGCLAFIINIFQPITGKPPFCLQEEINSFVAAVTIIPLVNDTLVFLAISWRLSRISYDPNTLQSGIRIVIFGDYLPLFSRALLQDGQAYYLTIVTTNVIIVIMLYRPSNPDVLRTIWPVPGVILMNVMAGRVFRNTILFSPCSDIQITSTAVFQNM